GLTALGSIRHDLLHARAAGLVPLVALRHADARSKRLQRELDPGALVVEHGQRHRCQDQRIAVRASKRPAVLHEAAADPAADAYVYKAVQPTPCPDGRLGPSMGA